MKLDVDTEVLDDPTKLIEDAHSEYSQDQGQGLMDEPEKIDPSDDQDLLFMESPSFEDNQEKIRTNEEGEF